MCEFFKREKCSEWDFTTFLKGNIILLRDGMFNYEMNIIESLKKHMKTIHLKIKDHKCSMYDYDTNINKFLPNS